MEQQVELKLVPHVLYEAEDTGILWVKLNRPERMNATAPDTVQKVAEYMRAGDADPTIRVIVLTGVGRGFCAGNDMKNTSRRDRSEDGVDAHRQHFAHYFQPQFKAISEIRKPTIAMVNGPAAGSGLDMSLHCDLRVGCENSRFITYQRVGQIIENGGFYFLPRIVGLGRTLEFLYTGGELDAEEAYRWGLLNRLVPSERLEEETRALCDRIIKSPPMVQWIGKRITRRGLDSNLDTVMDLCANASGILGTAEDRFEARRAFLEKRDPVFKGR
jgi:2-(1,2-epoxy-1,2-dihydrophenyl)acetyl-CoA isomerase